MVEKRVGRRRASVVALLLVLLVVDLLLMDQRPWTTVVAAVACVLLASLALTLGLDRDDLGLGRETLSAGVRGGGVLSVVVVIGFAVALWIPAFDAALDDDRTPHDTGTLLVKLLVVIPIRTVLLEEFAFRGVLWGLLARARGERAATWGSACAFGLWHVPPALVVLRTNAALEPGTPVAATLVVLGIVVATTAAGVLFGELRRRTGSLAAPALLHWTVNSAASVASRVSG